MQRIAYMNKNKRKYIDRRKKIGYNDMIPEKRGGS